MSTQSTASGPRRWSVHTLLIALLALAVAGLAPHPAQAQNVPRAYAGIVVDAKTGNTLYSHAADALRYPASLTKVMTLYILFQELEAGRMSLGTQMNVSRHAAAAVPTKLWVRAGSTISVENAIQALVTLSANDVARVVAENISGTESQFAERMTQTARALGMSNTTYRNASGLPDSRQVTTARDQARLAIAIYQHYPRYYEYFQTRSFRYNGNTYSNHNRLLGQHGVDGIKTGYINASGYNLMTAARANNRHIAVIGLGFNTGAARNARVLELVRTYMPQARQGDYWQQAMIPRPGNATNYPVVAVAIPVTPMPRPANRDVVAVQEPVVAVAAADPAQPIELPVPDAVAAADAVVPMPRPASLSELEGGGIAAAPEQAYAPEYPQEDVIGAWLSETYQIDNAPPLPGEPVGADVLMPPVSVGAPEAIDLLTSGSAGSIVSAYADQQMPAQVPFRVVESGWVVQVGAAPSSEGAAELLTSAADSIEDLGGYRSYIEQFQNTGQTYYRARFGGFASREQAVGMCDRIMRANMNCLAVQS